MKSPVKCTSIILILMLLPVISVAGGEWKFVADKDGTTLFVREVPGHSEAQFKGVRVVDRPLEHVGWFLSDIASYPRWFFKCIEAKKIPTDNSSERHFFLYVAIDTPWPFADRDVVYETDIRIDYVAAKVVIQSRALKRPLIPLRTRYVRITDSEHQWILEKITADRTRIVFINRTNVAGPFASYLSNAGTRDTTIRSLANLNEMFNHSNADKN